MSGPLGSQQWMYASGGFYPFSIDQSLRFNDNDSAYLSRTPASAGNRKTWTWSGWVKRGNLGSYQALLGAGTTSPAYSSLRFMDTNKIQFFVGGAVTYNISTTAVYRDASAWYHICFVFDVTETIASDRCKLYVNGVEQTLSGTFPTNSDWEINNTYPHAIGAQSVNSVFTQYFDGYMAEVNFIDGTALDATSFGETINGIWVPKQYSGSYGTNGFYLSFADSAAIGDDLSGNTNDFTATNLAASDVVPDSPTNNFATLNPLQNSGGGGTWFAQATLSEGNLKASLPANSVSVAGMKGTGKLYAEVRWSTVVNELALGLIIPEEYTTTSAHAINTGPNSWRMAYHAYAPADIYLVDEGTSVANPAQTVSAGDIFQVAWDTDNGNIWFGYNNSWYDSSGGTTGNPSTGVNPTMTATTADLEASLVYIASGNSTGIGVINFGQDSTFAGAISAGGNADANGYGDFAYAPPSGFLALCSANLDEPAIGPNSTTTSDQHFNTVLYTGDGTNGQAITGVGHQPDFLWIKSRSGTAYHELHDSVRGAGTRLFSNDTAAESTVGTVSSFDSDGFTVSRNSAYDGTNQSGVSFVGWNWKAGGTAVSNTDGSITTSVSTNTDAGISIIKYTGNGTSSATIGHNLGVTPDHIIIKRTSSAEAWVNWHKGFTATQYLRLYQTNAVDTATTLFNSTLPSSSVITLGNGGFVNTLSEDYICYAFAEKEGFSKFGTYVGNANANGPFVYTGFRPAFVLLKVSSAVNNWFIYDNKREGYNQDNDTLSPNLTTVEDTSYKLDLVSNGFKIRGSNNAHNQSGQTFIYLAFAEAPFKYANAR